MHESNIGLLRDEAQRLLSEEIKLLEQIQITPNLLVKKNDNFQTFDTDSLPKAIERLQGEKYKLESLNLVLAVVGTMKAGKSTTINAIVGMEILPNRNRPMTALPTLIRHTKGITEPRLIFSNTEPVNQLIQQLSAKLSKVSADVLSELNNDADMQELLERIRANQAFVSEHDGAEAIFNFLKGLNDLVRLSTVLSVEFPFSAYSRIESLPLIEVEFTHLSQMDNVQGHLTLLDTPGPNEAGQEHLRPMLRDQLKKASAVLAVLDYTQLKSDADQEMRKNLEDVAKVTGDRLYALVNRFDQKDRNSDSSDDVRKYVSSTLMKGLIAPERIFPISARFGYLASQARNELALRGKLPPHETHGWVADFAKHGIGGPRWESKLEDIEEVNEAANFLWKESQFSAPLDSVIRKAYARAPILAVDSSAAKMVDLAENVKNFLGTRQQGLKKSVEEIQRQVTSLQSDIDTIQDQEHAVSEDVKRALADVNSGVRKAGEKAQQDILSILDKYFTDGKRIEANKLAEQKQSQKNPRRSKGQNRSWSWGRKKKDLQVKGSSTNDRNIQDFDLSDKPLRFENKEEAKTILDRIKESIETALSEAENSLQENIKQQVKTFNVNFQGYVNQANEIISSIKKGMHKFDLIIRLPDVKKIQLDFIVSDVLDDVAQEKTEKKVQKRRESGVWGTVCGWFNTDDWGWELYSVDIGFCYIDIEKIKEDINESISSTFKNMGESASATIEVQLTEQTEIFFSVLLEKVAHIRGDLIASMNDKKRSQEEQSELLRSLSKLECLIPDLLKDTEALAQDVKNLLADKGTTK